ncbi:MAG: serine/threonine protein kinase, partial [Holophagales bacterium]|nr:serine/threonine protein kinase [Holophagales bacterium]
MSEIQRLGKYEIVGTLGQGSFGVVYRGRDPYLQQDVAIKVCTLEDEELRRRFFREAEISKRLSHPNVVSVHSFAFEGSIPYLVQEYLEGEDLRDVIRRRAPWTAQRKLGVLVQVAEGMAYAHSQGVVHRDLKPANIRLLADGRVKVMDFGIAKLATDESRLTKKGVTLGTASYLPPEQVRGSDVDHRADLFSFGVLAYELLSFERPFRGKTISALVYQILYKPPAALHEVWSACPPSLSALVAKCLEKEPADRYPEVGPLLEDLHRLEAEAREGLWPSLLDPTAPISRARPEEGSSSSEILSRSMISRTAQDVEQKRGAATGHAVSSSDTVPTKPREASERPT